MEIEITNFMISRDKIKTSIKIFTIVSTVEAETIIQIDIQTPQIEINKIKGVHIVQIKTVLKILKSEIEYLY